MIKILQQFLILFIISYSVLRIFYLIKNASKKYKNIPTMGMVYLIRIYNIKLPLIGINNIEKDLSLINSFIIAIDLLIYFTIKSMILKLGIIFITTFVLIFILYSILGNKYKKMYRR